MGNKGRFGGARSKLTCGPEVENGCSQLSATTGARASSAQVDAAKLSQHGFWLQKYSGLHAEPFEAVAPEAGSNEISSNYHMLHSQPASPVQSRLGLLARWRTQFNRASHQSDGASQSPKRPNQPTESPSSRVGVAGAANKDNTATNQQGATGVQVSGKPHRAHRCSHASRLLRSLSSSTSALLSPLGPQATDKTKRPRVNESAVRPETGLSHRLASEPGKEHTKERKQQRQPGAGSWLSVMLSSPRLFRRTSGPTTKHKAKQQPPTGCRLEATPALLAGQVSEPRRAKEEDRVAWLESEQLQLGMGGPSGHLANIKRRARQTATGELSYANELAGPHCQQASCRFQESPSTKHQQPARIPGQATLPPDELSISAMQMVRDECCSVANTPDPPPAIKCAATVRREPLIEQLDVSLALSAGSSSSNREQALAVTVFQQATGSDVGSRQGEVMLSLIQARGSSGSSRTSSLSPASSSAASGGCSSPEPASSSSSSSSASSAATGFRELPAALARQPADSGKQLAKQKSQQPLRCSSGGGAGEAAAIRRQQLVRAPSSGVQQLKSNFKKLVERQQSVDSYRIARELRNKQRRQRDQRHKHQSNEAIPIGGPVALKGDALRPLVVAALASDERNTSGPRICLSDDVAADNNGNSTTAGNQADATQDSTTTRQHAAAEELSQTGNGAAGPPAPPNTLSLMASRGSTAPPFVVGSFSGSITPTYMTHHLQSPCRGLPAPKKYSNASTVSSSLCADTSTRCHTTTTQNSGCSQAGAAGGVSGANGGGGGSDTESSVGFVGVAGSPSAHPNQVHEDDFLVSAGLLHQHQQSQVSLNPNQQQQLDLSLRTKLMQEEAARRAQLAEHIYDNKCGLGEDMKFLASLPELCDITFLVGETREPVCAVKSVLAARSRVFHKILFGHRRQARPLAGPQAANGRFPATRQASVALTAPVAAKRGSADRKTSSPKLSVGTGVGGGVQEVGSRRSSPHQWSVTEDASGYGALGPSPSSLADSQLADSSSAKATATATEHLALKSNGRVSLASERAESGSLSQASAGSQQPLIVGPGQTATRAPLHKTKKKGSMRGPEQQGPGSRLSRMFMKRASDPNIKHQHPHHQLHHQVSVGSSKATNHQIYIDKISWCQMSTTMIIEEFEPDVFRQLIEYIHTGCVLLQARTLLGLLNAADYYGLEQLRRACLRFVSCCITVDTVCSLLSTAERYIQYKCTKSIVQKVLEFVDTHANEVFKLNAFGLLPEHVVRLILAREGLQAEEQAKYNGVYTWCEHYCRSYELASIADVMRNFLHLIQFHKISRQVLLNEIYPTRTVPDNVILIALAEQVRPRLDASSGTAGQVATARRMTLPNPGCLMAKDSSPAINSAAGQQHQGLRGHSSSSVTSTTQQQQQQQPPAQAGATDRKSGGTRLRQGSIAQVSLSNVMRLSHKFSIKRRRSAAAENGAFTGRRDGPKQPKPSLARQQSALCTVAASSTLPSSGRGSYSSHQAERESIQLGKMILDAHLRERAHEQELAEGARRQPIMQEPGLVAAQETDYDTAGKSSSRVCSSSAGSTGATAATITGTQPTTVELAPVSSQAPTSGQQQHQASTKRSFKDFRSISRRIFMRRSSTRQLYSQQVHQQSSLPANSSSPIHNNSTEPAQTAPTSGPKQKSQLTRRNLLRIKRSDTVFETAPGASY